MVAICHPYKETYQFLLDNLSEIQQEFELVKLSDLMEKQLILEPDLIDPEIMIVEKLHKVEVEKAAEESLLN